MYNEKKKRHYLETFDDDVRTDLERLFAKTEPMETNYKKDLAACTLEELAAVFHHLAPNSPERSVRNKNQVEAYIRWSNERGYETFAADPLGPYGDDWCQQFVTSS